jgi:hypothetical protein
VGKPVRPDTEQAGFGPVFGVSQMTFDRVSANQHRVTLRDSNNTNHTYDYLADANAATAAYVLSLIPGIQWLAADADGPERLELKVFTPAGGIPADSSVQAPFLTTQDSAQNSVTWNVNVNRVITPGSDAPKLAEALATGILSPQRVSLKQKVADNSISFQYRLPVP